MKSIIKQIHHRRDDENEEDSGFTLVEILIAIVLVGILSAVVVVGISNLTSKGTSSACSASLDAAKAGTVVYYASNANAYPTTLTQLTTAQGSVPAALTLPSGVTVPTASPATGMYATGGGWTLTMTAGTAGAAPTFSCANSNTP